MAVVQYTGIVNQLRGKLNGSVFNKSRTAYTLQRKQQQSRGFKGNQQVGRQRFSGVQRSWKDTTPSQKSQWQLTAVNNPTIDRFGQQVSLAGYNQFVKANIFRQSAGEVILFTPDSNPAPSTEIVATDYEEAEFSVNPSGGVQFETEVFFDAPTDYSDIGLFVELSLPISPGVSTYHGRFVLASVVTDFSTGAADINVNLGSRYPLPREGQQILLRFRGVYLLNGSVNYSNTVQMAFIVTS